MSQLRIENHRRIHVVGMGGTMRSPSSTLFTLKAALRAAGEIGASTELLDLRELDLPIYHPGESVEDYGPNVARLINAARRADAMLWSTAAYHGTLAGVTKNAIDYFQLLSGEEDPYLHNKAIGLIATAGGDMAAVNAANAMVHSVHSLRGTAVSLMVPIPKTWTVVDPEEGFIDPKWSERLEQLGQLVVSTAAALRPAERSAVI